MIMIEPVYEEIPECSSLILWFSFLPAGMNGFLKAEFSNMWTATLQNKESFKRLISKLFSSFSIILKYFSLAHLLKQ